jgi:hypothetical protein
MSDYIRRKQGRWQEDRQREADEEAKRKAEREAELAAEALKRKEAAEHKKLLLEQQEADRLHQKRLQEKKELDAERMSKQVDTLVSKLEADQRLRESVRLQEIKIIIQNREPYFGVLDWRTWLSDPLNKRLAELDFEYAVQMFRRDNRLASRRQGTGGKIRRRQQEFNYALSFSGDRAGATDSYATTTFNPDTYELWNGFTISFWVRPDERMNQTSVILGCRANNPTARFKFGIHSNGNINIGIGGNNITGINNPMEEGKWYNWVVSYAGTQHAAGDRKLRFWINNDPRMTTNNNTAWNNQDEGMTVYFGGRNTDQQPGHEYTLGFACALTNVAIYNTCKDSDGTFANEVYNNGINYNYDGSDDLVGYWRFSEGEGITIADTSGNGNNGTFGAIAGQTTAYPIWEKIE